VKQISSSAPGGVIAADTCFHACDGSGRYLVARYNSGFFDKQVG
jgi:hypothetical protein